MSGLPNENPLLTKTEAATYLTMSVRVFERTVMGSADAPPVIYLTSAMPRWQRKDLDGWVERRKGQPRQRRPAEG